MDLKDNINHYGYTWKSMDKNIDSIKSIKASKFKKFIFNYLNHKITTKDLKFLENEFDKQKTYNDLIQYKNNYSEGILPTIIKMCHFTYYRNFLSKQFFNLEEILFYNEELLILKYNKSIFINIRGTITYKQFELMQNLSFYKKQFYLEEEINNNFLKWKNKFLKKYSIKDLLKKDEISDRYLFHKGFLELYQGYKIKNKVIKIIEKYTNINTIFISGHSLGGGLSTLLTIDLYQYYYNLNKHDKIKINITTFGAPGVMNSNLSLFYYYLMETKFINKYIRIINKKDIISSSFTDPTFLITKFTGILRHIDASIPKEKKKIIKELHDKINKKIIIINCEKNLKKFFLDKRKLTYVQIHSLFSFSDNNNSYLFSI